MFFFIICALQPEWGDDSLLEEYESPLWFHKDECNKNIYAHKIWKRRHQSLSPEAIFQNTPNIVLDENSVFILLYSVHQQTQLKATKQIRNQISFKTPHNTSTST